MSFRVELDLFRGPLDLLLYLVRKHELDIAEVPVAVIADQFCSYLEVLAELDFDLAGDFLEVASTLVELKASSLLPSPEEDEPPIDEAHEDLVQRLLQYKQYRDAASMLEDQARQWQQCYSRMANDLPGRPLDLSQQPLYEVEVWDLVSAFGRIIREARLVEEPPSIVYDETPMHVYMQQIHDRLAQQPRMGLHTLFQRDMHKSTLIGLFLALLELVRHQTVAVEQPDLHGEIWIVRGEAFRPDLDLRRLMDELESETPPAKPK